MTKTKEAIYTNIFETRVNDIENEAQAKIKEVK
jgi:hypothetical protein